MQSNIYGGLCRLIAGSYAVYIGKNGFGIEGIVKLGQIHFGIEFTGGFQGFAVQRGHGTLSISVHTFVAQSGQYYGRVLARTSGYPEYVLQLHVIRLISKCNHNIIVVSKQWSIIDSHFPDECTSHDPVRVNQWNSIYFILRNSYRKLCTAENNNLCALRHQSLDSRQNNLTCFFTNHDSICFYTKLIVINRGMYLSLQAVCWF